MSSLPALKESNVNSYAVVDCISVSLLLLNSNSLEFNTTLVIALDKLFFPALSVNFTEIEFSFLG